MIKTAEKLRYESVLGELERCHEVERPDVQHVTWLSGDIMILFYSRDVQSLDK